MPARLWQCSHPRMQAQLGWLALVPWLAVLLGSRAPARVGRAVALSYAAGVLWYLGTCYWVFATMHQYGNLSVPMSLIVMVLFALYLGLYHALFGALVAAVAFRSRLGRAGALAAVPFLWVAVELARARVTSFPWNLLGVSAIDNLLLTRLAPVTGAYGLSFVLAGVNALLACWFVVRRRTLAKRLTLAGVVLAVALAAAGKFVVPPLQRGSEAATLLQPNLLVGSERESLSEAQLLQQSLALSEVPQLPASVDGAGVTHVQVPSVVLWPESPSPYATVQPLFLASLAGLAGTVHAPVVAGASGIDEDGTRNPPFREYNSAALFLPGSGYAGRYDKIHLVPFGEFVPYADLFSFASGLTREVGTVERGQHRHPLEAADGRYGVFMCYESIFGDEVRQFVLGGADVLVNLSDDGWYGDTSAPFQHINMARMRAVENHRWLLRDTNSGITAAIDPEGRVLEWAPRHVRTAVQVHFSRQHDLTFYTQHGDLFAYACAAVASALLVLCFVPKR